MISLLEINRLSELDYHEHHMGQVLGYEYSYSTLTQFLGELAYRVLTRKGFPGWNYAKIICIPSQSEGFQ